MIGEDVKGKIWEVQAMCQNDSTYRGTAKRQDFYFKSLLAKLEENEDEYSRCWVYLSDNFKNKLRSFLEHLNDDQGFKLPQEDELTSYDNPEYLWLAYELEHIRHVYNSAMVNPYTGELLAGCKKIPYVQLRLKLEAFSIESLYPKTTVNSYDRQSNSKYVIEFDVAFLKAFMNFIVTVFEENPQTYIELDGYKYITHQYRAPIYRMPPFKQKFDSRHDIPGMIFSEAIQMLLYHELAHIGGGHLDLKVADPEYGNNPDVQITEEDEADNQAICWLLGIRFLESPSNILEIGADDLKEELAMSIFAVYLLYTWNYSGMERMWNKNTISEYGHKSHLPYQLRAYRMLSVALSRLQNLDIWCEDGQVCSADGEKIKKEFFEEVKKLAFQMINSFETSLSMFFAKTENIYELAQSERLQELYEMVIKEQDELIPEISKEKVPWLLGYAPEGQAEMKRVHDLWKDVREHLEKNGTYCRLRKFEEWVPLG